MAIIETSTYNNVLELATLYAGRTVEVRTYEATRNHSDTLDYSDFRTTNVTEALVYIGRRAPEYTWDRLKAADDSVGHRCTSHDECRDNYEMGHLCWEEKHGWKDLLIQDRFVWVDCTNLFVWRGSPHCAPEVDAVMEGELAEDYAAWQAYWVEQAAIAHERQKANEKARLEAQAKAERDRPVKGKKMVVVKGRKVPKGTVGTVAYIHPNGGVLLKDDARWEDRNAPGTWVDARNLEARP